MKIINAPAPPAESSRVIRGVHWQSAIEAARAAGLKSPLDCAAEAQALASAP